MCDHKDRLYVCCKFPQFYTYIVFVVNMETKRAEHSILFSKLGNTYEINIIDMIYCAKWEGFIFTTAKRNSGRTKLYFSKL